MVIQNVGKCQYLPTFCVERVDEGKIGVGVILGFRILLKLRRRWKVGNRDQSGAIGDQSQVRTNAFAA